MLSIIQLAVLENNYIFILHEPQSGMTAVIDPAVAAPVLQILKEKNWTLHYILNTHHHWDHIGGNQELTQATSCQVATSIYDQKRIPCASILLQEGQSLQLGHIKINIIETPGHTLGHIVFYIPEQHLLFCGDTLFAMGCGRLFEGTAEQLWHSLQKLRSLPSQTQIYCAHEYTQNNGHFALTIEPENQHLQKRMCYINALRHANRPTIPFSLEEELATNPFLRTRYLADQQVLKFQNLPETTIFSRLRHLKDIF